MREMNMNVEKMLVFDMDGTIADLYAVENWLSLLRSESTLPYRVAKPMYDMSELCAILNNLKSLGWTIAVTSWSSKGASSIFTEMITKAKIDWLSSFGFPYDICNIVEYGVSKSSVTKQYGGIQILFDDSEEVRNEWSNGETVDANKDILSFLYNLILRD